MYRKTYHFQFLLRYVLLPVILVKESTRLRLFVQRRTPTILAGVGVHVAVFHGPQHRGVIAPSRHIAPPVLQVTYKLPRQFHVPAPRRADAWDVVRLPEVETHIG